MRFRRRLGAAILAVVMMVSSIQIPGGTSYAAGTADSSMESGYDASILTAEGTEGAGTAKPNEGTLTDDGSRTGGDSQPSGGNAAGDDSQPEGGNAADDDGHTSDDNQTGDGNAAGGDSQPGDGNAVRDDSQPGDGNVAGDDSQPGDDNPTGDDNTAGDDSQTSDDTPMDDGDDPKQEADVGQEMDIELEPNEEIVSYSIEGALQFGDMPEVDGRSRSAAYNYSDEVFDYVYRQMMKRVEYIDLYEVGCLDLEKSEYSLLMRDLLNSHPDLWFVEQNFELVLEQVEDEGASVQHVKAIIVHYKENGGGYDYDAFEEKTHEALMYLTEDMSDVEKVVVLHDWLVLNCEYAHEPHCNEAYGALVDGIAVCGGYTLAYKLLLDLAGIKNYYVSGWYDNLDYHAWNMVELDGKYYYVDVTVDDGSYLSDNNGSVNHNNLLYSDEHWAAARHEIENVIDGASLVDYRATDPTYDKAFWNDAHVPLFGGDECYYFSISDKKLMKVNWSNVLDPGTEIADSGFDKDMYYFYPLCSTLVKINDRLYYNGEYDIYSIKTDGTDKRTEFTDKVSGRYYMRAIEYREGKIYYHAFDEFTSSWVGWLPADIDIEPEPDNYKIRYWLNGGTNDSGNPDSYNSETETITLKAPTKDGSIFTGWYTDKGLNYEVTEIPKGSTGNIALFAGWRPETDNPSYTFTTVDGQTVSSGADGRPKVLFFFDMSVGINERTTGRRVLMDLSEHIKAFDGVDLYAIEISGKSSDEVAGFQKMYGCDEITFCYDKDGSNKEYAEEYTNGNKSNLTIVIIDAKNLVKRVTNNMSRNWIGILTDLQEYCGYDDWYGITYELDGGENYRNNPYIYKNGADDVILKEPFKAGYLFEGWYKDKTFTRPVTKIPNDSKGNLRLYAKWGRGDGFNAANEDDSYTALDGTKLKSEAEGRPKLLVFYDDAGAESASVIRDIAGIIEDLDWVDIYAIDIGQNAKSREKVRQFADTYGCDGITFSYRAYINTDTESMERYLAKAGIEASTAELPVICYIDAANYFQWVSMGNVSEEEIIENLKKYCGYSSRNEGIYKITYKLGGGKNDRQNPASYTSGTKTIILKDPSRTGYTFEGWYKDADYKEKITEIAGESTGDITIYAKWSVGLRLNSENYDFTFTALDGTQLSSNAEGRPKLLIFYDVAKDDSASTVKNIADNINVLDGVDVYAINFNKGPINGTYFNANTLDRDYVSQFKDAYGCDGITFAYMSNQNECNSYIYYANTYLQKAGYRVTAVSPVLCYIDEENNLQYVSHVKVTVAEVLSCLKNSCGYLGYEGNIYRINYRLDGGTNDSRNPEVYIPGTASIDLWDPFRTCCVFEGWYEDPEFGVQVTQIPKGSTGDITLYAKWKKGLENPDYTFDTLDDETVSSRADGKPKVLFFFRENSDECKEMSQDLSQYNEYFRGVDIYAIEATLAKKAKVVNFKNDYGCDEITFCYCDSVFDTNWKCLKDYANIAGIDNDIPLTVYIDSQNLVQYAELGQRSYTEVLANLRDYCDYRYEDSERTYKITYVLDGGTNDSANPDTYTSGTETITLKDAVKDGYKFDGWYKDADFREKVTEIVKGSTGKITLYAKWRKTGLNAENLYYTFTTVDDKTVNSRADGKPKVLLFFVQSDSYCQSMSRDLSEHIENFNGVDIYVIEVQYATREVVAQFKNDYGCDEITFCYDTSRTNLQCYYDYEDIARTHYNYIPFTVYIDSQNRVQYAEYGGISYTKVLANLRDYCDYRYEDSAGTYKITYKLNGGTNDSANPDTYTSETETITLKDAVKEGYTFEGWYKDADFKEKVIEIVKGSAGNITLYAKWKEIPLEAGTYRIIYELNGGTNSSENPATYTSETETITLKSAVKEGYTFEGWYKDADFREKVTEIVKGSIGNITLYARWSVAGIPDDPNDREPGTYKVMFDVQGHGTAPQTLADIKAGSTIDRPEEPAADGYRFDGWYKDSACTKSWDFGTDTVQSDLTLYAKWLGISSDSEFAVQEITDVYYTGKAQKPTVSVYDENTLLKAGKDYTIKYYNNINANKNGVLKGETFNNTLPYVEITGKGNYKETVRINFNILPASIGNDLSPAAGVTLKVNDQLVKANKEQKPFGSIKYGRSMKEGTDYELELMAVSVRDQNDTEIYAGVTFTGAKVPANYTGEFMLTVTGTGNYTGSISRRVYVTDKAHLMKNVKITLGKDLKNRPYTGSEIELTAAEKMKPANDEFVVTYGKTALKPGVDYDVSYNNNVGVGKAELVVTGKNGYVGSKTATFNIKGKTFANGTVEVTGLVDQAYTGRAIVQNENAVLTWKADGTKLIYGVDYTVSYSKNINKGSATITFTGVAKAGYSGKISKKFKIGAADISKVTRAQSMNAIILPYTKAGVKPVDEIILTNEKGTRLQVGKDYTLAYKNNKAVANAVAEKAPTVTVKGKGNYSGSFGVEFTIEHADLRGENITVECAQTAYNSKKKADYEYKPAVTVKDGKTKLKANVDYEISYVRNTQADYNNYLEKLIWDSASDDGKTADDYIPVAVITAKAGSAYTLQGQIEVPLQIYTEKLTKTKLDVKIDPAIYTGGQVKPKVTVEYKGENGNIPLEEGVDYTLVYGANTASGKNKGSVTVKGLAPYYGGSVTYKFEIIRKDLKYWF